MKTSGNGRIYLRKDLSKDDYIQHCFRTGTVSILLDDGGVVDNIAIDKSRFTDIEFPVSTKKLGSQVFWVMNEDSNQPIIIAVINKTGEIIPLQPFVKGMRSQTESGVTELLLDGKKSIIILNASSQTANGGDIHILSNNQNNTSKLKIFVSSNIDISSRFFDLQLKEKFSLIIRDKNIDSKTTQITIEKGKGISLVDEFGNKYVTNKDGILMNDGKNGGIPNIKELNKIIDTLQQNIIAIKAGAAAGFAALAAIDGGASTTAFNGPSTINSPDKSQLEDEKVKH
jgi:hypothetical protein